MNKVCAFTIVAKNYIGLAKILRDSFLKVNTSADFFIVVADECHKEIKDDEIIEAKTTLGIDSERWTDLSFKYSITEFCTAIKPFSFELFFGKGYDAAIYIDPDCYVFDNFDHLFSVLQSHSMVLVPHVVSPIVDVNYSSDAVFLQSGIYNLGFLGLHNDSDVGKYLRWWGTRLINNCFDDLFSYTFTDQKWMNFATAFMPSGSVWIERDMGYNIAPWNYCERMIIKKGGAFYVRDRGDDDSAESKVIFAHFSGYDYRGMLSNKMSRIRASKYTFFDDITQIVSSYSSALLAKSDLFRAYIDLPYSYNFYSNGDRIDLFHRRLYRRVSRVSREYSNPFDAGGLFYSKIRNKNMIVSSSVSGMSINDIPNSGKKMKIICSLFRMIYKLIGYRRYIQLLKMLKRFSRFENQVFLIDTIGDDKIIY